MVRISACIGRHRHSSPTVRLVQLWRKGQEPFKRADTLASVSGSLWLKDNSARMNGEKQPFRPIHLITEKLNAKNFVL